MWKKLIWFLVIVGLIAGAYFYIISGNKAEFAGSKSKNSLVGNASGGRSYLDDILASGKNKLQSGIRSGTNLFSDTSAVLTDKSKALVNNNLQNVKQGGFDTISFGLFFCKDLI